MHQLPKSGHPICDGFAIFTGSPGVFFAAQTALSCGLPLVSVVCCVLGHRFVYKPARIDSK